MDNNSLNNGNRKTKGSNKITHSHRDIVVRTNAMKNQRRKVEISKNSTRIISNRGTGEQFLRTLRAKKQKQKHPRRYCAQ